MPYADPAAKKVNARAWNAANADRVRERARVNYQRNRDRRKAQGRNRYAANRLREIERSKRRRQEHPEKTRASSRRCMLKRKYGLTPEKVRAMLAAQGGCCGMPSCGATSPGNGKDWSVDHDHATKIVRGLLCFRCNVMIGFARDNPDLLRGAAAYLERVRNGA